MKKTLRALQLEDSPHDAELVQAAILRNGISCEFTVAGNKQEFQDALAAGEFDIILADYNLPQYDAREALKFALAKRPDVPFIIISGTIGEEIAVEALKSGATDYVMKSWLEKTGPAILRAMAEVEGRMLRRHAQEQILRIDRALRVTSHCNKTLVRATDESALFDDICRTIVQMGGYSAAWVAFLPPERRKGVIVAAQAGFDQGEVPGLGLTLADEPQGCKPARVALLSGNLCVLQDVREDPGCAACQRRTSGSRRVSAISLPLRSDGRLLGALSICASETNAFTREEIDLLEEMAEDLAFGVQVIRARADRARAEKELLFKSAVLEAQAEATIDAILVVDAARKVVLCNRRFAEIWRVPPDLLSAREDEGLFAHIASQLKSPGELLDKAHEPRDRSLEKINDEIELRDGRVLERYSAPLTLQAGEPVGRMWYFHEITQRKWAEREIKLSYERLRRTLGETAEALASTLEKRDPYTAGHQQRATRIASAIVKCMGLPANEADGTCMAGTLHDIGKISVPSDLLTKPGKLTPLEAELIKQHVQVGYDILKDIEFPWPVAEIVRQHHERVDGSGYPNGLTGERMLIEAKVLAVADVVEAMASHRPYRPALGADKAMEEIARHKGKLYDAAVVDACTAVFKEGKFAL